MADRCSNPNVPQSYPEPKWPDTSLPVIIDQAFAGQRITTPDHPAIKQIRQERS
jgi:hypothetical protein